MFDQPFPGQSELAGRMREFDWTATPLGAPATWPQSLTTATRIMLTSRQPIWIGWGPELTYLYNDAYKSIIGGKHPDALGRPTSEVWREIWDDIGPMLSTAMTGDQGTYVEAQLLIMERNGYPEETYYTFSYSPIPDDEGGVGGIICANTDDTRRVIGERQLALLRELAADTVEARTPEDAYLRSVRALGTNPYDLPFAMLYVAEPDGEGLSLVGAAGIEPGHPAAPARVDPADAGARSWPLGRALKGHGAVLVPDIQELFGPDLPTGSWKQAPTQAALLPINPTGETGRAGVLIVGLNPYRLFDDTYEGFLNLAAGQIASSIANAQAYEEERRRAEVLAELDHAKTMFFSNVSHEFRTPLTLMLGPITDILSKPNDQVMPDNRGLLEVVYRNGLRLLRLVNTLLDFSRIEAGRVQASYQPTDLAGFTAELASNFRAACEQAGLRLVIDARPLPEPVYVDREMWEKIVLNLISNAFKFTFEGEIDVSLRPVGRPGGNAAELRVRDTGTGIPAEEMPRLFERFHRVENAHSRTHEGSGIGLALVQELVKLHGGSVTAESVLGEGTTFIVTIPIGTAHLPAGRIAALRTLPSSATSADAFLEEAMRWLPNGSSTVGLGPASGMEAELAPATEEAFVSGEHIPATIVVADDNADMRDYIRRLLGARYNVLAVADGLAALEAIGEHAPDLIVSDVMMPRLDGFGLLRAIRENPATSRMPVLMLSARSGEESRIEGLEAGADDYLTKPFSGRELLARVAAHLELARVRRESDAAIRTSEERYRLATRATHDVVWDRDLVKDTVIWSDSLRTVFGYPPEQAGTVIGDALLWWVEHLHPDDRERVAASFQAAATSGGEEWFEEYRFLRGNGTYADVADAAFIILGPDGLPVRMVGAMTDITERKRAALLQSAQRQVLELIALDAPLAEVFGALILMMEQQSDSGMLGSIFLLEDDGGHLRCEAGPSLPEEYSRAVRRVPVGEGGGSCGAAAYRREPVFVSDIATDPLWDGLRELALESGLRACWSIPIIASDASLLGTLVMYYPQPRTPNDHELRLVDIATRTAAIAIERRRATDALRYRSEQFETLLNQAPMGVYLVGADFRIREVNPVASPVFGDVPGGIIGRDFDEIVHLLWEKEYADEIVRSFRRTLETGEPYVAPERAEYRIDRNVIEYYEWHLNRITLPDGRYGLVCYFRDISAQVQARTAIAESERRLRFVLDSMPQKIFTALPDGGMDYVNPAWTSFSGFSAEEIMDWGWTRLIHPDDLEENVRVWRHAVETGELFQMEHRFRHYDGRYRWHLSRAVPMRDVDGGVRMWIGSNTDIDDVKQAQEAALRRSEQLRWLADISTRLSVANDVSSVVGVLTEEARQLIGSHQAVTSFTVDEDWAQAITSVSLSDKYAGYRGYDVQPDGSGLYALVCRMNRPIRMTQSELEAHPAWKGFGREAAHHPPMRGWLAAPLTGRNGKNIGLVQLSDKLDGEFTEDDEAVLVQLAHLASIAIENAQLVESLREGDRRKDEFLATLAHELRNPLAPIRSGLELMKLAADDEEAVEQARAMMERQLGQMVRLIDDLLDISRITRGKIELRRERIELGQVIRQAVETSRPHIEARGHELRLDMPSYPIHVSADATRLAQVFSNLLNNAAKFTDRGGQILLAVERQGEEAVVSVRDTGVGIPPEMLSKIFEMFTQVEHPLGRTQGGLGIGLSLVKGIVEMHGGGVVARSGGRGTGSEFVVHLPVIAEETEVAERGPGARGPATAAGRRILVVDDNQDAALSMAMMLRLLGSETQTAHDGLMAVEMAETFQPDLILLDIGMPKLNGYEAARRIRQMPWGKEILLVALTGWGQERDRQFSREAGFDGHLVKPVAREALMDLLASL